MTKGRKENPQSNGATKGTFRFRYMDSSRQFEVNADNVSGESLLEGFRHVANAITGRAVPATPKLLRSAAAAAAEATNRKDDQEEFEFEPTSAAASASAETADDEILDAADEPTTDPVDEKKTRPAPRAPKFLAELNLTTASKPLKDFIEQKNADNDLDRYAVIAVWYKQHFNTEEVSIDHIFTAYDHLGWKAQLPAPDPSQTLRNLKKKNWLVQGSKRGFFKVNWNGEDAVNKMGPEKAASKGA